MCSAVSVNKIKTAGRVIKTGLSPKTKNLTWTHICPPGFFDRIGTNYPKTYNPNLRTRIQYIVSSLKNIFNPKSINPFDGLSSLAKITMKTIKK